jgi:hypothetical protein
LYLTPNILNLFDGQIVALDWHPVSCVLYLLCGTDLELKHSVTVWARIVYSSANPDGSSVLDRQVMREGMKQADKERLQFKQKRMKGADM